MALRKWYKAVFYFPIMSPQVMAFSDKHSYVSLLDLPPSFLTSHNFWGCSPHLSELHCEELPEGPQGLSLTAASA